MNCFRKFFSAAVLILFTFFLSLGLSAADVAVISREAGYYSSLGKHLIRWLKQESVEADFAEKDELAKTLKTAKLAFLVGYDDVSEQEMRQISAFCARGGRLVVFYSASPRLAQLMRVKVVGYKAAQYPGQWSSMNCSGTYPTGLPKTIRQTSSDWRMARQGRAFYRGCCGACQLLRILGHARFSGRWR